MSLVRYLASIPKDENHRKPALSMVGSGTVKRAASIGIVDLLNRFGVAVDRIVGRHVGASHTGKRPYIIKEAEHAMRQPPFYFRELLHAGDR